MNENTKAFEPDWAVPPGAVIGDAAEEQGLAEEELARCLALTPEALDDLRRSVLPVTEALALRLAETLGSTAAFWLRLEANYRADLARRNSPKAAAGDVVR